MWYIYIIIQLHREIMNFAEKLARTRGKKIILSEVPQTRKTNITCSLSLETPSSKSSEVRSTQSRLTAENRKVK